MTETFKLAVLGLALLIGQAFLNELLGPSLRPDLVLIFALAMGVRRAATRGLLLAFAIGFAFDVSSGAPLGLYALLRGTACAMTCLLDRALYLRAAAPWAIFAGAYVLVDIALLGLVLRAFAPDIALGPWDLLVRAPGPMLATALLAAPLLAVFKRLEADADREAGWAALSGARS